MAKARNKQENLYQDIEKEQKKFDKLNQKGKLSPVDIEKWTKKIEKMREKAANQDKKVKKAEHELEKL
ncbi:hypothetical protein BWG23_10155 [Flavobacterium oreochromis]|nr:hypothetical protein BWG23_10155 [Flavobacterium oreochromis]